MTMMFKNSLIFLAFSILLLVVFLQIQNEDKNIPTREKKKFFKEMSEYSSFVKNKQKWKGENMKEKLAHRKRFLIYLFTQNTDEEVI